ncbi:melatonin receptor type 1B-like [Patiria miniata]|uniref:G-protein coupled receptors family 1 profile domain-containing protein n=1 Tax=Patiria miniata TaxID=46514 RepID=A0A914A6Y2_PATMI|nr:melatonin receptor type 1B-like [Patiria miniata]
MDSYVRNSSHFPPANDDWEKLDDRELVVAMAVYISLLSVSGFVGNILVIVSVAISPRLRTTSYAFIVNLSVADLAVNVLSIPLVVRSFLEYGWPHDPLWCRWVCYLFLMGIGVSLFTLTAVAASRYCLVAYPRRIYNRCCGMKAAGLIVANNWFLSLLLALIHHWGNFDGIRYIPSVRFCFLDAFDGVSYWYVSVAVVCIVCFILIPLLYCMTFRTLYVSQRRLHAARRRNAFARHRRQILHPAEIKLTKMLAVIFLILLFCWTPIWVTHFVDTSPHFQRLGVMLVLTNSSVNPFVYAWLNEHFKRAFKRILLCRRRHRARVKPLIL